MLAMLGLSPVLTCVCVCVCVCVAGKSHLAIVQRVNNEGEGDPF